MFSYITARLFIIVFNKAFAIVVVIIIIYYCYIGPVVL